MDDMERFENENTCSRNIVFEQNVLGTMDG